MKNKTCLKSFQYSARANLLPDERFLKEIKKIKEQAEQSFVGGSLALAHSESSYGQSVAFNFHL